MALRLGKIKLVLKLISWCCAFTKNLKIVNINQIIRIASAFPDMPDSWNYSAFYIFEQTKLGYFGLFLVDLSPFPLTSELPQKITLAKKVAKSDSKTIISLH